MKYDYLILGGGAAGTIAAETIRSRDPKGTIAIINNEKETLYSKVMLTNLLAGKSTEAQLRMRSKDDYIAKKIDLIFIDYNSPEITWLFLIFKYFENFFLI